MPSAARVLLSARRVGPDGTALRLGRHGLRPGRQRRHARSRQRQRRESRGAQRQLPGGGAGAAPITLGRAAAPDFSQTSPLPAGGQELDRSAAFVMLLPGYLRLVARDAEVWCGGAGRPRADRICCIGARPQATRGRAGGLGGTHRAPPGGGAAGSRRAAVRVLRPGVDRGLPGSGDLAGPAARPGAGAGGRARPDRGQILRRRAEPDAGLGAPTAGRRPRRPARRPGPRMGRGGDRGVRAGVLRRAVRVDGAAVRALRHRSCGLPRSAAGSTSAPKTTSRP